MKKSNDFEKYLDKGSFSIRRFQRGLEFDAKTGGEGGGAKVGKHPQFRDGRMNLEESTRSTFEDFRIAGFSERSG